MPYFSAPAANFSEIDLITRKSAYLEIGAEHCYDEIENGNDGLILKQSNYAIEILLHNLGSTAAMHQKFIASKTITVT